MRIMLRVINANIHQQMLVYVQYRHSIRGRKISSLEVGTLTALISIDSPVYDRFHFQCFKTSGSFVCPRASRWTGYCSDGVGGKRDGSLAATPSRSLPKRNFNILGRGLNKGVFIRDAERGEGGQRAGLSLVYQ